jgi:hypothetical protein
LEKTFKSASLKRVALRSGIHAYMRLGRSMTQSVAPLDPADPPPSLQRATDDSSWHFDLWSVDGGLCPQCKIAFPPVLAQWMGASPSGLPPNFKILAGDGESQ